MDDCITSLADLVRSIAASPDRVTVTRIPDIPLAYEIRVAPHDYSAVLAKLGTIKTLAAAFAGLPEGRTLQVTLTELLN